MKGKGGFPKKFSKDEFFKGQDREWGLGEEGRQQDGVGVNWKKEGGGGKMKMSGDKNSQL